MATGIYNGSNKIRGVYLGSTAVKGVYCGSTKIWPMEDEWVVVSYSVENDTAKDFVYASAAGGYATAVVPIIVYVNKKNTNTEETKREEYEKKDVTIRGYFASPNTSTSSLQSTTGSGTYTDPSGKEWSITDDVYQQKDSVSSWSLTRGNTTYHDAEASGGLAYADIEIMGTPTMVSGSVGDARKVDDFRLQHTFGENTEYREIYYSASGTYTSDTYGSLYVSVTLTQKEAEEPEPVRYTLSISKGGDGSGTVDSAGGTYDENEQLTITATPDDDSKFSYWSISYGNGGGTPVPTNPLSVTMTQNLSVTAMFAKKSVYTIYITDANYGEAGKPTFSISSQQAKSNRFDSGVWSISFVEGTSARINIGLMDGWDSPFVKDNSTGKSVSISSDSGGRYINMTVNGNESWTITTDSTD